MPENYDDYDRREDFDRGAGGHDRAKSAVMAPAIFIIIFGVVGLLNGAYNLYVMSQFDTVWAEAIKQQEADPNKTAQQKKEIADMMNQYKDIAKIAVNVTGTAGLVASLLMLFGGIRMMGLKSRGLSYMSAILIMLPFVSCCCVLGLPFGIWAIVVLGRPDVKAGFDAVARGSR